MRGIVCGTHGSCKEFSYPLVNANCSFLIFHNEIQLPKNLELYDFGKAGIVSVSKDYDKLLIVKEDKSTNIALST